MSPLEVIAERESIYRLLGQTTPENLNRDYAAYTLDPHTRYTYTYNIHVLLLLSRLIRSLLPKIPEFERVLGDTDTSAKFTRHG